MLNEALKRSAELMKQDPTPCIMNLFMLTIAGIVNAFGITLLMTPVKLYDSGILELLRYLNRLHPLIYHYHYSY